MVDVDDFAKQSGVDKRIVKKYLAELEEAGVDWQYLDLDTIASEIQDFSQTGGRLEHKELRKRFGLGEELGKTAEQEAWEQGIESQLYDKPGVKSLLNKIYGNDELSKKQKESLKDMIISASPEITTLIALHNGDSRDYAKEFLKEMVFSPTAEIRELLKGDTLKIKSSRGWIHEINDIPLKKKVRSIDLIDKIQGYEHVASSSPSREYTIAVYSREKPVLKPVEAKPVRPPVAREIKAEAVSAEPKAKSNNVVDEYTIPESRPAMGGKPLSSLEFCYRCGRGVKTDEYSKQVNGNIVYFCSTLCYHADKAPQTVVPKYGIGQTVSSDTIAEIRKKPVKRASSYFKEEEIKPEQKITTEELVESHLEKVGERAEELALAYSYGELKTLGTENNLRLKGSKVKMISQLIRANVL